MVAGYLRTMFLAGLVVCAGCVGPQEAPQVGHVAIADQHAQQEEAFVAPEVVTLDEAIALALSRNPWLNAAAWELPKADTHIAQARLLPNPELELEAGEFGGTGELAGADSMEVAAVLSQEIELGGKRSRRTKVAKLERELAELDHESARLDVIAQVTKDFVAALAAGEQLTLKQELLELATKSLGATRDRVTAGKTSPLEETRAQVAVSVARTEVARAERELAIAGRSLATNWGVGIGAASQVKGALEGVDAPDAVDGLLALIDANPDVARWNVAVRLSEATLALEESGRVPNIGFSIGGARFEESGEEAMIAGISIPLQIFDRNQAAIREASLACSQTLDEQRAARSLAEAALMQSHQELLAVLAEATTLREAVTPAAQAAFDATVEAYQRGKLQYLDVLDAQRTLFEVKAEYVDALLACRTAQADLDRLVATHNDNKETHNEQ